MCWIGGRRSTLCVCDPALSASYPLETATLLLRSCSGGLRSNVTLQGLVHDLLFVPRRCKRERESLRSLGQCSKRLRKRKWARWRKNEGLSVDQGESLLVSVICIGTSSRMALGGPLRREPGVVGDFICRTNKGCSVVIISGGSERVVISMDFLGLQELVIINVFIVISLIISLDVV
ncbi:hypothetical protein BJ166DRAFT_291498 [Pestalotiopsis sp. NC0098]|nr:hypothetical protein BJ166DRAFT_291498 [Pestalotiopsis sp. NC0098]